DRRTSSKDDSYCAPVWSDKANAAEPHSSPVPPPGPSCAAEVDDTREPSTDKRAVVANPRRMCDHGSRAVPKQPCSRRPISSGRCHLGLEPGDPELGHG